MAGLERVRFMVVDDNTHMIHIVKTILRGFGATQVFEARDAGDAFQRLRNDAIDIVIVDFMMEVLDGVEFVHMVRNSSDSPNRYVPIIMLTAHSERSRVTAARDAGVNEFCAKPVTALELYRKVAAVIDKPRPFIKTASYFGPDRRRRQDAKYQGKERREGWSEDHKPPAKDAAPPADESAAG
ncbi:response regulator [Asticcacaulis excentricus]|uniref:Response regulator receiver protein n=1 Tax=Asticcacaulis excentricus (strain ATCC 15261 / DSM 4724 / KCTC 12464 / NCIMB 9791 / VKM B-1370 / CB 48) TaxID=573065 RepID=E8RL09_ASTEC|nr:response regulator [Asticcacaulis excentricus]ADU13622.1 response regulator receiver protein [Asticcacaulis excentricus CB 48]